LSNAKIMPASWEKRIWCQMGLSTGIFSPLLV
jgi:hypothetical protein